jgi:hypothetical protein
VGPLDNGSGEFDRDLSVVLPAHADDAEADAGDGGAQAKPPLPTSCRLRT